MSDVLLMLGTRPELTKTSPFILEMIKQRVDFSFVFTGQHYDSEMSTIFMKEFGLPAPDQVLGIGGVDEFTQFGKGMKKLGETIRKHKPKLCVVNGDTNSTLMSALASAKSGVPVAHIEAGCRSFDFTMPEEINRILTDRLCHILFPSTEYCAENLISEGFENSRIFMFGNTAVDGFKMMAGRARKMNSWKPLGVEKNSYVLVTLHRKENVDDKGNLRELLLSLGELDRPVVFPMHPRTRKRIREFGLMKLLKNIHAIEPVGYLEFLSLLFDCRYVVTDSGGVMEEAVMAGKRVIIPRKNIEWYEIVERGAGILCPPKKSGILKAVERLENIRGKVPLVYPDLGASRRIAKKVKDSISKKIVLERDFFKYGRPVMALNLKGAHRTFFNKNGRMTSDKKKAVDRLTTVNIRCGD